MGATRVRVALIVLAILCGTGAVVVGNWWTAAAMALLGISQAVPLLGRYRRRQ